MAAHVDGQHVMIAREVRRDVIERVRVPRDAMQQDHRRPVGGAPLEIVKAQAVDGHEPIGRRRDLRGQTDHQERDH